MTTKLISKNQLALHNFQTIGGNQKQPRMYVNSKELSEVINLPVTAIQRLVREQRIPAYKIDNKQYLFKLEEVVDAINIRRVN